jgi:hypothetical protein
MRIRQFEKNLLYSIISFTTLIRVYHHYNWRLWGSDSGEYLYLTRYLLEKGSILNENYIGWGRAYPDFQGMQIFAGTISLMTEIEYHIVLLWFIPLASALAIPLLFIIGKRMVGFLPALFGSAFYGVTFGVVYANSHPMPGGLAETLGFVFLYSWIKCLESNKVCILPTDIFEKPWSLIFLISFLGLLMTHHFTLLLMTGAILGILITEIAAGNKGIEKQGIIGIGFVSIITSIYWLIYADSFGHMLNQSAFDFLPDNISVTLVMTLIPLFALTILWSVKDYLKLPLFSENLSHKTLTKRMLLAFTISFVVILLTLWKGVPGTQIPVGMEAVPYLMVNLAWISMAAAPTLVISKKYGWGLWGWLLPMLSLAAIGAITGSHLLIAYRHAPYLLAPVALIAGIGFQYFIKGFEHHKRSSIAFGFSLLFVGCSIGAYPPPSVMGGFQEGTSQEEFDAILWFNFVEEDSLVVSDHRLSSLTFGLTETNASWENGAIVITGNTEEAISASEALSTPQAGVKQVTYIALSSEMQKGVALLQWDPAEELTGEAKTKFTDNDQFPVWFDNGDTSIMRMNPY